MARGSFRHQQGRGHCPCRRDDASHCAAFRVATGEIRCGTPGRRFCSGLSAVMTPAAADGMTCQGKRRGSAHRCLLRCGPPRERQVPWPPPGRDRHAAHDGAGLWPWLGTRPRMASRMSAAPSPRAAAIAPGSCAAPIVRRGCAWKPTPRASAYPSPQQLLAAAHSAAPAVLTRRCRTGFWYITMQAVRGCRLAPPA